MTSFTDTINTSNGEYPLPDSVILAATAQQAVEPKRLEPNTPYALLQADGSLTVEVTPHPEPDLLPDHISARRTVGDPESFVAYVQRHFDGGTEVYADLASASVTAIIDGPLASDDSASPAERVSWEHHRLTLSLQKSPAWQAWEQRNGKWLPQLEFAEHLEDNLPDIVSPPAADMLEIAQSIQATRGVEFKSSQRLSTGETQITYAETTDARAGKAGTLGIPEQFTIAVIPFIGGLVPYRINVRFRYRLRDGDLLLAYKMDRPEVVLEDAFKDVLSNIKQGIEETEVPVFHGRP